MLYASFKYSYSKIFLNINWISYYQVLSIIFFQFNHIHYLEIVICYLYLIYYHFPLFVNIPLLFSITFPRLVILLYFYFPPPIILILPFLEFVTFLLALHHPLTLLHPPLYHLLFLYYHHLAYLQPLLPQHLIHPPCYLLPPLLHLPYSLLLHPSLLHYLF